MELNIEWCSLTHKDPASQVYFVDNSTPCSVIRKIGMKITMIKHWIREHFEQEGCSIPIIKAESAYQYYVQFHQKVLPVDKTFPCPVQETSFESVDSFKVFLRYILENIPLKMPIETYPPLIVSADGILRYCKQESEKVIKSSFSSIFEECLQFFLHPKLTDVKLPSHFLLIPSEGNDDVACIKKIDQCLSSILPCNLANVDTMCHVANPKLISSIWECFSNDEFFKHFLKDILGKWAILMAKNGRLYSCCQKEKAVIPIIPLNTETQCNDNGSDNQRVEVIPTVHSVCQQLNLPFLDTETVPPKAVTNICPSFNKPTSILQVLNNFHSQHDISRCIKKDMAQIFITYFGDIHLKFDKINLGHLKHLPLFQTHQGNFSSLTGKKVFQWPDRMCRDGEDIWQSKIDGVVFLDPHGAWSELELYNELGVASISPTEIYCRFIFPTFKDMSESVRYKHLHHILEGMHLSNQIINHLKTLPCIGNEHSLKAIDQFYDQENIIFKTFNENFMFLPDSFKKGCIYEGWKSILGKLGFHLQPTPTEFLDLCHEMAEKQHSKNTREKSYVLFKHLFERDTQEWFSDSTFLSEVVNIPFIVADICKRYTWLAKTPPEKHADGTCEVWPVVKTRQRQSRLLINFDPFKHDFNIPHIVQCSQTHRYGRRHHICGLEKKEKRQRGRVRAALIKRRLNQHCTKNNPVYLTKLMGACVHEDVKLVWSVKPIYHTPRDGMNPNDVLSRLGVNFRATVSDVVHHLVTISETGRAYPKLFDTYTAPVPSHPDVGLIDVIAQCLEFLNNNANADIAILKVTACIPVPASGDDRRKIVLVKPSQALTTDSAKDFFPYLHRVPNKLMASCELLNRIEVEDSIKLSHIQLVLGTVHNQLNGAVIDPNTRDTICRAIKCLCSLLPTSSGKDLSPLYLPGRDNCLHHTSELVYPDSYSYKDCKLPQSTNFVLLHHPDPQKDQFDFANHFCPQLPENMRPKPLSQLCCQQIILQEFAPESEDIEMAKSLKIALTLEQLPNVCISAFKTYTKDCVRMENIKELLSSFFQRVNVVTVNDLEVELAIKSSSSVIGKAKVEFYLNSNDGNNFCLYLDSKITRMVEEHIHKTMVQELLGAINNIVGKSTPGIVVPKIHEAFCLFLKAQTDEELHESCKISGIELEDADFVSPLNPEVGRPVPKEWHYMLDQNTDNIFHSQEIVGYEISEGNFIFAQVLYALPPGDVEVNQDSRNPLLTRYMIAIPDEKMVTALDIFKFVREPENTLTSINAEVQPEEGVGEEEQFTDATEAKSYLCKLLKEIWKMDESERSRAIRRLYLKWHPDKNLDNVELANEVFVFLKKQIERLEQGLDPEDIDEDEVDAVSPSSQWRECYRAWDETADSHTRHRSHHEQYFRSRPRWSGGASWSGGLGSGMSGASWPTPKPDVTEGQRWVQQAEYDLMAVEALYEKAVAVNNKLCSHVCFMAHEVAEKALKGGVYAICGLGTVSLKTHTIRRLSCIIRGERNELGSDLPSLALPLERYYLDTRFPNRTPGFVPSDQFTLTLAQEARDNARKILKIVKSILHSC